MELFVLIRKSFRVIGIDPKRSAITGTAIFYCAGIGIQIIFCSIYLLTSVSTFSEYILSFICISSGFMAISGYILLVNRRVKIFDLLDRIEGVVNEREFTLFKL